MSYLDEFHPEPVTAADRQSYLDAMHNNIGDARAQLKAHKPAALLDDPPPRWRVTPARPTPRSAT